MSMLLSEIQHAIREEGLDGWLFFDHHQRDPLAYRILGLKPSMATRRWYYLIPVQGEPRALVHQIESHILDSLPGPKTVYSGWNAQTDGLRSLLTGCRNIAMQYSPNCAIPYVSLVDGGTIELVRSTGVEIASSANLVQLFEARWTAEQLQMHLEAGRRVDRIRAEAFKKIGDCLRAGASVTEWQINRFIRESFEKAGLFTEDGPIVAVNANMSDPHYEPTAERHQAIRKGDAVLIDMWAKLDQPHSVFYDITWTGFCGDTPPERFQNIFEIVRDARNCAIERVKKQAASKTTLHGFEVDDAARN